MNLTNHHNLPDAIVRAVKGFDAAYKASHGKRSDISVTTIIQPPQIAVLKEKHDEELSEDVSERLWALMGNAVHELLAHSESKENAPERLYGDYAGWVVSGEYDRMQIVGGLLQDYKFMSVWEVVYGLKADREAQLNCLAQLAEDNGRPIKKLSVIAILRDWQQSKAQYDDGNYPKVGLVQVPVPLWPTERRLAYLDERVTLHKNARAGQIPPCTDEERWYSGNQWAVMKQGNKKATKVFDEELPARNMAMTDKKFYVEHRPGEYKRCESYCAIGKAGLCPQHNMTSEAA